MGAMDFDGTTDDTTAAALRDLMTARRAAGDLAGALPIAEQLLAESRQRLGPRHPESLSLALAIANWRQHLGDLATAAEELGRLVPLLENELGGDHVDTLMAHHMLASYAGPGTDPTAAVTTWLQLYATEQRVFGVEHETTLGARHNVAVWRRQLGDITGAVDEMTPVVAARARLFGAEHPDTLASRLALATWSGEAGDTGTALLEATALVPLLRKAFGYDHEQTLSARHLCALWGQDLDSRALESIADWAVLVDDEIRALGVDHPLTVAGQTAMATLRADWVASLDEGEYVAGDRYQSTEMAERGGQLTEQITARAAEYAAKQRAEDEALLERVIVMKKETAERSGEFGEDSLPVLSARYDLAHALWNGHQYTGAADFTQRLLDDCVRIVGDEHELTVSARQLQAAGRRYTELGSQDSEPDRG